MSMNVFVVVLVSIVPDLFVCDVGNMMVMRTSAHQDKRLNLKSVRIEHLRVKVVYDLSFDNLENKENIKKYAVEPAVEYIQQTFKAKKPLSTPLLIDRFCAGNTFYRKAGGRMLCTDGCTNEEAGMTVPDKYLSKCFYEKDGKEATSGKDGHGAENTDILIFITAKRCGKTILAESRYVALDHDTDRPVAGILNICIGGSFQKMNTKYRKEKAKSIVLHELLHILGFSSPLYAFYRDEHGEPKTQRDEYGYPTFGKLDLNGSRIYLPHHNTFAEVEKEVRYPGKTVRNKVAMLRGPSVVREARRHFGCQNLTGIFLEDFGRKANAYSHLESNYFQEDIMIISANPNMFVSRITLAVLEDSGWYTVNFDEADNSDFGKDIGCDFLGKSCYEYIWEKHASNKSMYPYCISIGKERCRRSQNHTEICSLQRKKDNHVPRMYRYFNDESLVSSDGAVDFCPMFTVTSEQKCQQVNVKGK